MLLAYQLGRPDQLPAGSQPGWWGSVVPAVWSYACAAGRGWVPCGRRWCAARSEVAEVLGVDMAEQCLIGLFPVAYTVGTDFAGPRWIPPGSSTGTTGRQA